MKKIEGIILRSIDYKETSKIIYLLTKDRIESVLVRGVKKMNSKFKAMILNYNHVLCYTSDSKLPVLTDMDLIYEYKNIKSNLEKNKCSGMIIKVLNQTKYEDSRIYDILIKTLYYIDKDDEIYYLITFLIKNTYFLGISPNFSCVCEGNKKYIGFSLKEGTIVCENCCKNAYINMELTYQLNKLYFSRLEEKIDINNDEMLDFIKKYYQYHALIAL